MRVLRVVRRAVVGLVVLLLLVLLVGAASTAWWTARAEDRWPPGGELLAVDGVDVHVRCRGEGPLVVLAHGVTGTTAEWEPLQDLAADRYRLCAVDRPGHGWSSRPDDAGLAAQADLFVDVAGQLSDEPAVLVGHSWAGQALLLAGLDRPDEVAGLVLVAAVTHPEPGRPSAPLYRAMQAPVLGPLLRRTVATPFGRLNVDDELREAWAPQTPPDEVVDRARDLWPRPSQVDALTADALTDRSVLADRVDEYPDLQVPVAVVIGGADRVVDPDDHGLRLAHELDAVTVVERPDVGHAVPEVAPDAVLDGLDAVAGS